VFFTPFLQRALRAARFEAEGFLETRAGATFQGVRTRKEIHLERNRLNEASQATGYPITSVLGSPVAQRIAEEQRVFILGSGASVLELTSEQWREVRNFPSIGFGAWPLHPFVPNLLAFGPTRGLSDYEAVFTRVMSRKDIVQAKPEVLLLRSSLAEDIEMYSRLPEPHRSQASIYGRFSSLSRSLNGLRFELSRFFKNPNVADFGITFDSGSTLARMISFAIKSGAREIVLLGVDLNTPQYFWEANPKILRANSFESFFTGQSGSRHSTLTDIRRPLPVDIVIAAIHEVFSELTGGEISIGSQHSGLARYLPAHRWKSQVTRPSRL
jgi:hypothetical protein